MTETKNQKTKFGALRPRKITADNVLLAGALGVAKAETRQLKARLAALKKGKQ